MRIFIAILSLFCFKVCACSSNIDADFKPFAVKIDNYPHLQSYWVYFPNDDNAEKKMYLSSISAEYKDEFIFELSYSKNEEFPNYYSALLNIKAELVDKLLIVGTYNYSNSSRTAIALCGNWKRFNLKQLLDNSQKNV